MSLIFSTSYNHPIQPPQCNLLSDSVFLITQAGIKRILSKHNHRTLLNVLSLFLRRLCLQVSRKISLKTEHCFHCYLNKVLLSQKSLEFKAKFILIYLTIKTSLCFQEPSCFKGNKMFRLPRKSIYTVILLKTCGDISKQL